MELYYQQITIRQATSSDAALLASWWNDGNVMAHAGFPLGLGITEQEVAASLGAGNLLLLFDGQPIGEMTYRRTDSTTAEIGIKICLSQFKNKGIGPIALSLLIRELFHTGFTKIRLDTNLKNLRAQHVYETLGFQKTQIRYDSWKNQLGQWESSVEYALTEADFRNFDPKD